MRRHGFRVILVVTGNRSTRGNLLIIRAGGETSLLMAIRPDLVDLGKTFETGGLLRPYYARQPVHLRRRETDYKYIGVLTGEDDESNDPELTASVERGQVLLETIARRIAQRATALLDEGDAIT